VPLPSGVVHCGDSQSRSQCVSHQSRCVGIDWFSKINDVKVNATQVCKDQGYDGTINEYGILLKGTSTDYYQCGGTRLYSTGDLNDLGDPEKGLNAVAWRCEMKGTY
jgi:hypothetical protein